MFRRGSLLYINIDFLKVDPDTINTYNSIKETCFLSIKF